MTLADFAHAWWPAWAPTVKASTARRTQSALRTRILPALGDLALDAIGPAEVRAWFDDYSRQAPGGANRTLDVLQALLEHAVAAGLLAANPARGLERNPATRPTRFLSRAELRRVNRALAAHVPRTAGGRQQRDIIRLLLLTGCRVGEICRLRWSEVAGSELRLADAKAGPRTVVLSSRATEILAAQPRTGDWVFPAGGGPRGTDLSLWRSVRRTARVDDVRLHDLRHTFASHAVMQGVPLPIVSRLLGHRTLQMTMRYAHVGDRETARAAERVGRRIAQLMHVTEEEESQPWMRHQSSTCTPRR